MSGQWPGNMGRTLQISLLTGHFGPSSSEAELLLKLKPHGTDL